MSTEDDVSWLSLHREVIFSFRQRICVLRRTSSATLWIWRLKPSSPYYSEAISVSYIYSVYLSFQEDQNTMPKVVYRMEYAQFYGLLRLPMSYRTRQNITTLHVRVCFYCVAFQQ